MLDNLMDLVRKHTGAAVANNSQIPNEKNAAVTEQAGNSIVETLKNALGSGRITDVLRYFKQGGSDNNPIVGEATEKYAQDLQSNLGLDASQASAVAGQVVPQTMNELAARTNDPSDKGFNIQDIFNKLSGGKTSGFNMESLLAKVGGGKLDKDGDGDVDLQDLKAMFTGGGGLGETLKGLFK
jgi:hypothetical protein